MKKLTLLLAAALLLSLLSACGRTQTVSGTENAPFDWPDTPQVEQKNNSLTVYCMDVSKGTMMIKRAVEFYKKQYPDVNVEFITQDYDNGAGEEAYQQVAVEIMAGRGPDVLLIRDNIVDVEKLVRQGIFADMEPFFAADGFDWAPYNQTVMDGGVWDGRRYVTPLGFDFKLLITSRTALEETGFNMDACGDYKGFMEETRRYMEGPAQTRSLFYNVIYNVFHVTEVAEDSGLPFANYNTRTVDLSSPDLKAVFEWKKAVFGYQEYELMGLMGALDNDLFGAAAVRDEAALWIPTMRAASGFYWEYGALKTIGEAAMMPVRDLNGGIQAHIEYPVAVRGNSENLQNAYDFIKILLSEDVQCGFASHYGGEELSVLNAANTDFYQHPSLTPGRWESKQPGANGFYSTASEFESTDYPTEEEFEEFMGYVREISGTYYNSSLRLNAWMRPFWLEGADYDETVKDAQRALEINISE